MNNEFNQLLQIRIQKESKQRQIVQDLEREIKSKQPLLDTLNKSMALFNSQKDNIENALFEQISGQEMKPENLSDYQDNVKQIGQFDTDIAAQYQKIMDQVNVSEEKLTQARQNLAEAEKDVEKTKILVDSEQQSAAKAQGKKEEAQADEEANESWNR
jgi:hypothetical protein